MPSLALDFLLWVYTVCMALTSLSHISRLSLIWHLLSRHDLTDWEKRVVWSCCEVNLIYLLVTKVALFAALSVLCGRQLGVWLNLLGSRSSLSELFPSGSLRFLHTVPATLPRGQLELHLVLPPAGEAPQCLSTRASGGPGL
ncbi:hypothetical protein C8R43DRAFT_1020778 [Mycena crocata]|nr:hypothetical protein C8R43DRAFT_1020778 [Mycena crocata]